MIRETERWTLTFAALLFPAAAGATPFSIEDAVRQAVASNPQVQASRVQYEAATHQIDQAYTPQDPVLSWTNANTRPSLNHPALTTYGVSESFQAPGVSWLQGDQAHRNAEIARLTYTAAARDAAAQAQIAFYQTQLDSAAAQLAFENQLSFSQVLEVARVAYTANQAAQTDLISAQFAVSQASQAAHVSRVAEANDEAGLNQTMGREPETPLELAGGLDLKPLDWTLDFVKTRAQQARQELLEAALTEKNAKTAEELAWMELLPSFSVNIAKNYYQPNGVQPAWDINRTQDYTVGASMTVPIFFWFRQKEDIRAATRLLKAARQNRRSVELQTLTGVVQLYRSTQLAYDNAVLYRDLLAPLAAQDFRVALIAYQSKQIDFTTLAGILQSVYSSRVSYLTAANQFLAGRVALEQAMGGSLPQ